MSNAELSPNFAHISWLAALILANSGVADNSQIGNLGQIRQDLILHAVGEIGVLFIVTQIFKWQNRNRFYRSIDCSVLRMYRRCSGQRKIIRSTKQHR